MKSDKSYENYPAWIVIISNLVTLTIYVLGFYIISGIGLIAAFLYLAFVLVFEFRLIRYHCTNCFYYGKTCAFGRGRVSSWFFSRGDQSKFYVSEMSWKELIPDLLLILIPLVIGIFLLIIKFDVILLLAIVLLIILATVGSGFIRGQLACKYCKQRESGCPAEKLFNKSQ